MTHLQIFVVLTPIVTLILILSYRLYKYYQYIEIYKITIFSLRNDIAEDRAILAKRYTERTLLKARILELEFHLRTAINEKDSNAYEDEVVRLKLQVLDLQNRLTVLAKEGIYNPTTRRYTSPIKDMSKKDLLDLISLCHPDKHNNSAKATKITQELLKLRG